MSMFAPIVTMKSDVGQNFCRPWPTHRPHSGYCSLSHHMNYLCWNAPIHKKIRRNAKRQRQWWTCILSFESKKYIVPVGLPERKAAVLAGFLVQLNLKVDHPYHQYCHLYCHHHQHETPHQGFMVVMSYPLHQISVHQLWSLPVSPCYPPNYSPLSQSKAWAMNNGAWRVKTQQENSCLLTIS